MNKHNISVYACGEFIDDDSHFTVPMLNRSKERDMEAIICPHCGKPIVPTFYTGEEIVYEQMGHSWHVKCWEAFKVEYNDVLDRNDIGVESSGFDWGTDGKEGK